MWWAFVAILLSALVRSLGVSFMPAQLFTMVNVSAALWFMAFVMYLVKFGPMLCKPRADGHPG